jgi:hypothetical protein
MDLHDYLGGDCIHGGNRPLANEESREKADDYFDDSDIANSHLIRVAIE